MKIHVVRRGETLESISRQYGIAQSRLTRENGLVSENLAIGQALLVLDTANLYTVQPGETLQSIGEKFDVSLRQLYQQNPGLRGQDLLFPGQTLVTGYSHKKRGEFLVNGYAYDFINPLLLRETLSNLTYATFFTYGFTPDGNLLPFNDRAFIALAKSYGTLPWMHLSTLTEEGTFNSNLSHLILNDAAAQDQLIAQVLATLQEKGYAGVDIDFEFVRADDAEKYAALIQQLKETCNREGYLVVAALAPKTYRDQPGLLYQGHDYALIGDAANFVLLMTYEWGYTYGPPMAVAPINQVRRVLEYGLTEIPKEKIFLGIPNYAYDWALPYAQGQSKAPSLGNEEAVRLAIEKGAEIFFDEIAQTPYFYY